MHLNEVIAANVYPRQPAPQDVALWLDTNMFIQ